MKKFLNIAGGLLILGMFLFVSAFVVAFAFYTAALVISGA